MRLFTAPDFAMMMGGAGEGEAEDEGIVFASRPGTLVSTPCPPGMLYSKVPHGAVASCFGPMTTLLILGSKR
ncbi:hypothetical protein AHOG_23180 [Actinoalloteichus hoggarensis]|uniref:Uncharacterized protein n=1 Tax=Actinoalloteichus hoggarensis TaxID=1470176 RepID=A0A221W9F6_9PSEU|nr:hypothetical protein AHOG_23180 [Actinoalloteichus hoggarensis]